MDLLVQWLENDFMTYLRECEEQVAVRPGPFRDLDRDKMLIAKPTLQGLRITGTNYCQYMANSITFNIIYTYYLNSNLRTRNCPISAGKGG